MSLVAPYKREHGNRRVEQHTVDDYPGIWIDTQNLQGNVPNVFGIIGFSSLDYVTLII